MGVAMFAVICTILFFVAKFIVWIVLAFGILLNVWIVWIVLILVAFLIAITS